MPSWLAGNWPEVLLTHGWIVWAVVLFLWGAAVGSFLNVCISRLPLEKSLIWPGSRCGNCLQPIRWCDNIPLVSYWRLRGRCRTCGARFSVRYFLVELATGLGFAGLFYLEVVRNVHNWTVLRVLHDDVAAGVIPWQGCVLFGFHAVLFCFLLVAAVCDLDQREIPLSLTVTGTIVGVLGSLLWPWPFPAANPEPIRPPAALHGQAQFRPRPVEPPPWWFPPGHGPIPREGLYPWPVRWPLPSWLPPGTWQTGLATSLAGLLIGSLLLRAVRFVFTAGLGVEALGLGDADVMMMAGSFLGWQPVVMAFFVSVFPGLLFGVCQLIIRRDNSLPYAPALACGIVVTWVWWDQISPPFQLIFFWDAMLLAFVLFSAVFLFLASRLMRWRHPRTE